MASRTLCVVRADLHTKRRSANKPICFAYPNGEPHTSSISAPLNCALSIHPSAVAQSSQNGWLLVTSTCAGRAHSLASPASLGRGLWRQIALDAGEPLDVLAGAILTAYQFGHDHLYQFSYRNRFGVEESVQHPYMDEGPWTNEVRVGDVPLAVGQSMTYLFDFGDHWEFDVTLERIGPPGEAPHRTMLLDGQGDAPEQYPNWDGEEW